MEDEDYLFHQTPKELAKDLIDRLPLQASDVLFEPFKGEGSFYDNFPLENKKVWCEIKEGKDYKDITGGVDWVITNPPFKLDTGTKPVNSFYFLLEYFTFLANKGIAFLGNDSCFSSLNPRRLNLLEQRGWSITNITVCNVKKWRGRYFFIVFEKKPTSFYNYLLKSY